MVRVCAYEGCKTSARFNNPGEQKGRFCSRHKEPGMIDIVHPHCKVEGCTTLASFNISGHSRGEYCSLHKLDGMVNVKHRQCAETGCYTRPAFNWKGEEKGIYCNKHKEKGMVNVDRKDVKQEGEEGAEAPRKRGRTSGAEQDPQLQGISSPQGMAPQDAQQQQQQQQALQSMQAQELHSSQHTDYDGVARLSQAAFASAREQLPDLATLASDVNGFVGLAHALPSYAHLAQEYTQQQSSGLVVDPSQQRLPQQQLQHHHHHPPDGLGQPPPGVVVADMSQAAWPQQPDPHQGVVLQTTAVALGGHQQQHPQQQQHHHGQQGGPMLSTNASEPVAPDLPLPEDLKMLVQEGNGGNGSAIASPSGSLGHVMLAHVIKFTRELAQLPHLTEPARDVMCRYIEAFNSWDESKRVEQYSMLQFDWTMGKGDKPQAVLQRMEKVLTAQT